MSLGLPLPHDAAPLHVTGQARYADDIPLPGTALHLAFGLSTCAHGVISAIDLSAVQAAPGGAVGRQPCLHPPLHPHRAPTRRASRAQGADGGRAFTSASTSSRVL